jgi:hypothetical protein
MKRAAGVIVFACALSLLLAATTSARPAKAHVRKVNLNVVLSLDGTYSNSDNYGPNECNIEGREQGRFTITFHFSLRKIPLRSGVARAVHGADLSSGDWSQSGVRYDSDAGDCSAGAQAFECGGKLGIQGPVTLVLLISRGAVYLETEVPNPQTFGEANTESCGGPQYQLPYLGLADALEPWRDAQSVVSLRKLAGVKKHRSLKLSVRAAGTKTTPANCNGNDGGFGGDEHCSGSFRLSGRSLRVSPF